MIVLPEPKPDPQSAVPVDEPCLALASLGFPVVLITLLLHGLGIFLVRQGIWLPGPSVDQAWTGLMMGGVALGLSLSACGIRRV